MQRPGAVSPLVLVMLTIGALHVSENKFARTAYEASCTLLVQVGTAALRDSIVHPYLQVSLQSTI